MKHFHKQNINNYWNWLKLIKLILKWTLLDIVGRMANQTTMIYQSNVSYVYTNKTVIVLIFLKQLTDNYESKLAIIYILVQKI